MTKSEFEQLRVGDLITNNNETFIYAKQIYNTFCIISFHPTLKFPSQEGRFIHSKEFHPPLYYKLEFKLENDITKPEPTEEPNCTCIDLEKKSWVHDYNCPYKLWNDKRKAGWTLS